MKAFGYCAYCARWAKMTIDHVRPKSRLGGGSRTDANTLYVCLSCNQSKGSLTVAEWLLRLPKDWPQQLWASRFVFSVNEDELRRKTITEFKQSQRLSMGLRSTPAYLLNNCRDDRTA